MNYESSEPITLRKFKEVWENLVGLKYKFHYSLNLNGNQLENDEFVISDNNDNHFDV